MCKDLGNIFGYLCSIYHTCDVLILNKTGTITKGSRSAVGFIPMNQYTEKDIGQAAFAASIHDTTHEGKSIVDLAEEKKFIPPL